MTIKTKRLKDSLREMVIAPWQLQMNLPISYLPKAIELFYSIYKPLLWLD